MKEEFKLKLVVIEKLENDSSGKDFVSISTTPPVKSAGRFDEKDFKILMLSIILVGKISIWIEFLSGSSPGTSMLLSWVFVYLSPNPLMYTYLPPWIETPGILFAAAAALPSADLLNDCDEIASIRIGERFLTVSKALSVFLWTSAEIVTVLRLTAFVDNLISFNKLTSSDLTITSVNSSELYPIKEIVILYVPGEADNSNFPSKSAAVPIVVPKIPILAANKGSPVSSSTTVPLIIPFWENKFKESIRNTKFKRKCLLIFNYRATKKTTAIINK